MKNLISTKCLPWLLAGALVTTAASASANPLMDQRQVDVSYADLNLSRPADVQQLKLRLIRAAKRACNRNSDDGRVLAAIADATRCRKEAMIASERNARGDRTAQQCSATRSPLNLPGS